MSDLNVASSSRQTPTGLYAFTEHPLSCSGLEQRSIPPDAYAWFHVLEQRLSQFLQGHVHAISDSEYEHHDEISTHDPSSISVMTRDLIQFLKHDAFTERPSSADGNETLIGQNGTPTSGPSWMIPAMSLYQFLQHCAKPTGKPLSIRNGHEIPIEQNGMPMYAPSSLIPVESLYRFLQPYKIPGASTFESGHETLARQEPEDGSKSDVMSTSDSDVPTQSQGSDRVGGPLNRCPVCQKTYGRVQERDRHVESYLPHSLLCPFQDCTWTGHRQFHFRKHWMRKHSEAGQEDAIGLCDPREFVNMILDGTPVDDVAQSAFRKVQENLERLSRRANVWGRNRDFRTWIHVPSTNYVTTFHKESLGDIFTPV